jgi:hypothetical protein
MQSRSSNGSLKRWQTLDGAISVESMICFGERLGTSTGIMISAFEDGACLYNHKKGSAGYDKLVRPRVALLKSSLACREREARSTLVQLLHGRSALSIAIADCVQCLGRGLRCLKFPKW